MMFDDARRVIDGFRSAFGSALPILRAVTAIPHEIGDGHMEQLRLLVAQIVELLVAGQYQQVVELTRGLRMSADEVEGAISDYGRILVSPPDNAYQLLDIVKVDNVAREQYSIRMPLWTGQEGRSDLTLELTARFADEKLEVQLEDIHVL